MAGFIFFTLIMINILLHFIIGDSSLIGNIIRVVVFSISLVVGICAEGEWKNEIESRKKLQRECEELQKEFCEWKRFQVDRMFYDKN